MTTHPRFLHRRLLAALALVLLLGGGLARASWSWTMPNDMYQRLDAFERQQYERAKDLFRQREYEAAAAECENFEIRNPDSYALPYIVFLRAHALHKGKERNKAIQVYQQVLDYFGEQEIDISAAAMYWQGQAHLDNGDRLKGLRRMEDMVEHEDYRHHVLAGRALVYLADNYWQKDTPQERAKAIRYYRQIVEDFTNRDKKAANHAQARVAGYHIREQDYPGFAEWYLPEDLGPRFRLQRSKLELEMVRYLYGVALRGFGGDWQGEYRKGSDERAADIQAFWEYFQAQQSLFDKAGAEWDYHTRKVRFLAKFLPGPGGKDRDEAVDAALAYVKKAHENDPDAADTKYIWLGDFLRGEKQIAKARYCYNQLSDKFQAAWKDYEMTGPVEGNWEQAVNILEHIESMGDKEWTRKAELARADAYKDHLRKYDEALTIYRMVNEPPMTLWKQYDVYKRMKDPQKQLETLAQIEFIGKDPKHRNDGARAAIETVKLLWGMNKKKAALTAGYAINKKYKGTFAESWWHQFAERHGFKTSGGVSDVDL
jgi:tetratricopeptide (TPR) repeat protein